MAKSSCCYVVEKQNWSTGLLVRALAKQFDNCVECCYQPSLIIQSEDDLNSDNV